MALRKIFVPLRRKISSCDVYSSCCLQNFFVDIKGPALALLPVLAFEGGTRRNIPKFEVCIAFHANIAFGIVAPVFSFRDLVLCQFILHQKILCQNSPERCL